MKYSVLLPIVALLAFFTPRLSASDTILVPELEGDWWLIGEREPDVGQYSNPGVHNSCDFTIWKDADGMWQMDACSPLLRIFTQRLPPTPASHCWPISVALLRSVKARPATQWKMLP